MRTVSEASEKHQYTKSISTQVLGISEEEEEVSEKICKEIIVENSLT